MQHFCFGSAEIILFCCCLQMLVIIRRVAGKHNMAKKTFIDERFLV